jgi:translation initiation factor IF-3
VDEHGEQLGVFQVKDALRIAGERERDLIEIAPNANPPVCKIVEFGKFKYEHQKKEKLARKGQHGKQVKEIQLHPNIGEHDLAFKARHAREFLSEGNKVKVCLIFKGREMAYVQDRRQVLTDFLETLNDVGKVENEPKMEGRQMIALLAPNGVAKKTVTHEGKPSGEVKAKPAKEKAPKEPKEKAAEAKAEPAESVKEQSVS